MITVGKRIKELENYLGMERWMFADSLDMDTSQLTQLEDATGVIPQDVIKKICKTYDVSFIWLTCGEGDMIVSDTADSFNERKNTVRRTAILSKDEFVKKIDIKNDKGTLIESGTNKESINERVKLLRKMLNLSQVDFGKRIGIKKSAVSLIESGKNKVTERIIKSICKEFTVDFIWLVYGKGDIFHEVHITVEQQMANLSDKLDTLISKVERATECMEQLNSKL